MPNTVVIRRPFRKRGQAYPIFFGPPSPPMVVDLEYLDDLSRVRATITFVPGNASYLKMSRSTNPLQSDMVRGASNVLVVDSTAVIDDYEFPQGVEITYTVEAYSSSDELLSTATGTITVSLDVVWLKSIRFPFLNREVTVTAWSDITRDFRGGVFPVVGRSYPVAVTDLAGSRKFAIEVMLPTISKAKGIDYLLASGEPIYLQVPADCPIPQVYAVITDSSQRRASTRSERRIFALSLTETAAPRPSVVGTTNIWQEVINTFDTWEDFQSVYTNWETVLAVVSDPSVVVVE